MEKKPIGLSSSVGEALDWLDAVVMSVFVIVLLFAFILRPVGVDGHSMESTLMDKDKVIIFSLGYKPKAGDVVVVSRAYNEGKGDEDEAKPLIKRVIATGGQTVHIDFDTEVLYVDDEALDEPYIQGDTVMGRVPMDFPLTIPKGQIFVLGDNRTVSKDSRTQEIGLLDERYVLGHAILRIYPIRQFGVFQSSVDYES